MNEVYVIQIDEKNEYKLQFSTDRSGLIAPALLDNINALASFSPACLSITFPDIILRESVIR